MEKIPEEDLKLLKEIKSDPDLIKKVKRQLLLDKEQKQYTRKLLIKTNNMKIKFKRRELEFKRMQIKEKKCLEKHEDFLDGKRPLFMIESDIDKINFDINEYILQIKNLEEEFKKDEEN